MSNVQESRIKRQSFGRSTNSPLPAVPLPAKQTTPSRRTVSSRLLTSNENQQSASCGDLLENYSMEFSNTGTPIVNVPRANSMHFDQTNLMSQPLLQSNANEALIKNRHQANMTQGVPNAPLHDYEELPDRYKTLERKNLLDERLNNPSMSVSGNQVNCVQSQQKPTNGHDFPRERQNPMYSGIRAVSPFPSVVDTATSEKQRDDSKISERCGCILVICFIVSILISLLSIVLVILIVLGILSPVTTSGEVRLQNDVDGLKLELKKLQTQVTSNQQKLNQLSERSEKTSEILQSVTTNIQNQSSIPSEIQNYMTSLNSSQVNKVFGSLTSFFSSKCRYHTFAIGGSSTQKTMESGEYFVEKGYVVTGATCSSSSGYTASLKSVETGAVATKFQRSYNCICVRTTDAAETEASSRKECRIHYWQCPSDAN